VNHVAIEATNPTKVHRFYGRPAYRFPDMFALLKARPGAFIEHMALAGINLETCIMVRWSLLCWMPAGSETARSSRGEGEWTMKHAGLRR